MDAAGAPTGTASGSPVRERLLDPRRPFPSSRSDSAPGQGTRVRITLPASPPDPVATSATKGDAS